MKVLLDRWRSRDIFLLLRAVCAVAPPRGSRGEQGAVARFVEDTGDSRPSGSMPGLRSLRSEAGTHRGAREDRAEDARGYGSAARTARRTLACRHRCQQDGAGAAAAATGRVRPSGSRRLEGCVRRGPPGRQPLASSLPARRAWRPEPLRESSEQHVVARRVVDGGDFAGQILGRLAITQRGRGAPRFPRRRGDLRAPAAELKQHGKQEHPETERDTRHAQNYLTRGSPLVQALATIFPDLRRAASEPRTLGQNGPVAPVAGLVTHVGHEARAGAATPTCRRRVRRHPVSACVVLEQGRPLGPRLGIFER